MPEAFVALGLDPGRGWPYFPRMKICVIGIPGIPEGKHNIKDPRLDKAHDLVEAKKKTYAQVDVVGEDGSIDADVILVSSDRLLDVLLKDLEFIETRLSRDPDEAERAVLLKLQTHVESEQPVSTAGLSEATARRTLG